MNLSDTQVNDLARPLIHIMAKFYEDPKNEAEFQKWLLRQEAKCNVQHIVSKRQ